MMEPAAPGTEDEVVNSMLTSSLSKQEAEQERLLGITAYLPNGKYGHVFEVTHTNGSEFWYCNLCECPVMGQVYRHEIGKRHTFRMQNNDKEDPVEVPTDVVVQVAPGEPAPPGFEGVAQIQERLNQYTTHPLIGLEYLFELQEYDREKEPMYLCLLCDKRGDPRTVFTHLASYNHIIQYLQRHFVMCYRALSPFITKQYKRNWQTAIHKIAEALEKKFGRLKPHVAERQAFEKNRSHYQTVVATCQHFSDKSGVTFEELINKEELTKPIEDEVIMCKPSEGVSKRVYRKTGSEIDCDDEDKQKLKPSEPAPAPSMKPKDLKTRGCSLSSVSSISSSDLSDFDTATSKSKKASIPIYQPPHKRRKDQSPIRRSRSRSPYNNRNRKSLPPWQRSDYIRSRPNQPMDHVKQKNEKLETYKKLLAAIESDMERVFKQHEKNPEKHPQYNEEWKKFWNKRYKELQIEGKDATKYDFKPDWISYWNKKLLEIHQAEIKVKKEALRKRLGLPDEPAPICFKITGRKKQPQKETKPPPTTTLDKDNSEVIVIEDIDDESISSKGSHSPWESDQDSTARSKRKNKSRDRSKDRRFRSRSRSRDRESSWSRRSRDRDYYRDYKSRDRGYYREPYRKSELPDYIKPPRVMRDVTRHPVLSPPPPVKDPEPEPNDDDVNIVGVLRLLTALEEKLGSLGPKVNDLLAQALALEKTEGNSSETLLDNEINCVLFETVKEKLKGQLLAGLVDYNQERAFKNAIKKIASLIHFAGERKREKDKEKPKVDPIKVPGVGTVDKNAIAKQIATALVHQGKTDVSQAELEQLINAVVGMSEASRNSDKPITAASFFEQMSQQKSGTEPTTTPAPFGNLLQSTTKPESVDTNTMEGLSDLDLQTLLQNFKDLCTNEQHSLISYLKKLEAKEPERVERLRKFVNLDSGAAPAPETSPAPSERRVSPFVNRSFGLNPTADEKIAKPQTRTDDDDDDDDTKDKSTTKIILDSDDEDYTMEDVFKAAKQNLKESDEKEKEKVKAAAKMVLFKTEDFDLSNNKSILASVMGQMKNQNSPKPESPATALLGLSIPKTPTEEKVLENFNQFPINLTHLSNSINMVQKAIPGTNVWPETGNQQPIRPVHHNINQNITYPIHRQSAPPYQQQSPLNAFYPPVQTNRPISYPHPFGVRPPQSNFEPTGVPPPRVAGPSNNVNQYPLRPTAPGQFNNYNNRW